MKKGIARFTAFCVAAGMTFGGNGIVAMADGYELSLVGFGSMTKGEAPKAPETEAVPVEAEEVNEEVNEEEAVQDQAAPAEDVTDAAPETEAEPETETEPETELDRSMVDTTGFAQCEEYVNIRSSADTEGEVLGKLTNNAAVYIEDVDENGWYKVRSGNVEGYVAGMYIATGSEAEEISENVGYHVAEVGAEVLNVRASASQDSEIVTTVTNTQEVEVIEDLGDWLKVAVDADCYGYVSADYVATETQYKQAESIEEEQARLEAEYEAYLAEQAAAEAAYLEYIQQQSWNQTWQQAYSEPQVVYDEAAVAAAQQAQAEADAAYQAQQEAAAAAAAASQATSDAQAYADSLYQAYLEAQANADALAQTADYDAAVAAADAAVAAYGAYVDAQAIADQQAQAEADAAYWAQETANAQAAAEEQAAYAQQAVEDSASIEYTENEEGLYTEDGYNESDYEYDDSGYVDEGYSESGDTSSGSSSSSGSLGQSIADYAVQFVGNPYVYGGTSLTNGADCSGFVQSVMGNFGIGLSRTAASQSGGGTAVDLGDIQPGDLLFYEGGGGIGHVTMYIGNGQVVHASNERTGITISDIGYRTPVSARRYW